MSQLDTEKQLRGPSVGIVGAGIGGICLALALKRKGFHDFTIYDREDGIGGTWYQNRYPGCRCDVPAVLYSHSKHPKKDWTESHPPRAEILKYWEDLLQAEGLSGHIRLGHTFVGAKYASSGYTITFSYRGSTKVVEHDILVSAIGGFSSPYYPSWADNSDFTGRIVHTSRWPWHLTKDDLKGKKVAVVGNGCSGVQVVAALAEDPTIQVYSISRSPQWVIPNPGNRPSLSQTFSSFKRFLISFSIFLWLYRLWIYLIMEIDWLIYPKKAEWIRRPIEKKFGKWMKEHAPRTVQDVIVPSYPIGGRRLIRDGGYMEALNKPNVTPIWDQVSKLKGRSIVLEGGATFEVDYIVLATGFNTNYTLDVDGRDGFSLRNGKRSEAKQYHGAAMHGFPNYFTMLGNNISLAHLGLLFGLEVQAEYIANCISAMSKNNVQTLEAKEEACTKHTAFVDEASERLVWTETKSYWRSDGGTGRNFGLWPLPGAMLWADNVYPDFRDFHGGEILHPRILKRCQSWIARRLCGIVLGFVLGIVSAGQWILRPGKGSIGRARGSSVLEPKSFQNTESSGSSSSRSGEGVGAY